MEPAVPAPSLPADYYRQNAARVRELATKTTTPDIKAHLSDVAHQYDLLAERADEAVRHKR